jgi:glycerol-3-phosphate dehydrogenase (NAD(P)+)
VRAVVVGAGAWGTTFADLLAERGHEVVLAGRRPPAVPIEEAPLAEAELVCVAVPSRAFREVVDALPGAAPRLILTKGLDPSTGKRLSEVVRDAPVAVLSGPNHAE